MGVILFNIQIDNPSRSYSPGQKITGKLYLDIIGEETTSEIIIRFFGKGSTHWTESETRSSTQRVGNTTRQQTRTVYHTYKAEETYFDYILRVYGDGNNKVRIPPGKNVFPFVFQIPARPLPPSCRFSDGLIQYGLKAQIKKPWYQIDPRTGLVLVTITNLLDLNQLPTAGNPVEIETSIQLGCNYFCELKPCLMISFTPKLSYCPGEDIPLVVQVKNYSKEEVHSVLVTLTQVWTLFAYGHKGKQSRIHKIELASILGSGVRPGQSSQWNVEGLTVPHSALPTLGKMASKIVKMIYVIKIKAFNNGGCCGWEEKLEISHPVVVGSVPLAATTFAEIVSENT